MIKNIVFDIGNVLVYFRWTELMRDLKFSEETIEKLGKDMIMDPLWNEFDLGVMPEEDVINGFKQKNVGLEKEIDLFIQEKERVVCQFDYTQAMLKSLKEKGYHLYYLSNYPASYFECHAKRKFEFLSLMDGGVASGFVKMAKPDQKIYDCLLERYDLVPEECLFFDDRKENIEGAKAAGMHAILFENYEQAMEEMRNKIEL